MTKQKKVKVFTPIIPAPISKLRAIIFKGRRGDWYFHIKARNGEIIVQSEGYETNASCLKTAILFNIPTYEIIP